MVRRDAFVEAPSMPSVAVSRLSLSCALLLLASCGDSREPPQPNRQLLRFGEKGEAGFYLYRRGPMSSDYITVELGDGPKRPTLASIATCAYVAAKFQTEKDLEIRFYDSAYFVPGSTSRLGEFAASTPSLTTKSVVSVPSREELTELARNGYTVLDCQSAAGMDATLPSR
jgi:hypothetical protein